MRILGVSGSPKRGGNSDIILDKILKGTGADSEIIYLSDMGFSSCVGCERCRKDKICTRFEDDLTPLYEVIREAMGLVLVSPVHNYNITSWMKAFIDRLYCFYDFDDERPRGWSCRLAGQGDGARPSPSWLSRWRRRTWGSLWKPCACPLKPSVTQ